MGSVEALATSRDILCISSQDSLHTIPTNPTSLKLVQAALIWGASSILGAEYCKDVGITHVAQYSWTIDATIPAKAAIQAL